jgi:hypothetical protein
MALVVKDRVKETTATTGTGTLTLGWCRSRVSSVFRGAVKRRHHVLRDL